MEKEKNIEKTRKRNRDFLRSAIAYHEIVVTTSTDKQRDRGERQRISDTILELLEDEGVDIFELDEEIFSIKQPQDGEEVMYEVAWDLNDLKDYIWDDE